MCCTSSSLMKSVFACLWNGKRMERSEVERTPPTGNAHKIIKCVERDDCGLLRQGVYVSGEEEWGGGRKGGDVGSEQAWACLATSLVSGSTKSNTASRTSDVKTSWRRSSESPEKLRRSD